MRFTSTAPRRRIVINAIALLAALGTYYYLNERGQRQIQVKEQVLITLPSYFWTVVELPESNQHVLASVSNFSRSLLLEKLGDVKDAAYGEQLSAWPNTFILEEIREYKGHLPLDASSLSALEGQLQARHSSKGDVRSFEISVVEHTSNEQTVTLNIITDRIIHRCTYRVGGKEVSPISYRRFTWLDNWAPPLVAVLAHLLTLYSCPIGSAIIRAWHGAQRSALV